MTTKTVSSREHRTVSLCSNRRGVSPLQLSSTLLAMSLLALPTVVNAQTAAAPSTAAASASETIRLTPFEVSEAVDDSFNTSTVGTGGRLVLPGNVCAHTHLYSALARGMPYSLAPPESFGCSPRFTRFRKRVAGTTPVRASPGIPSRRLFEAPVARKTAR